MKRALTIGLTILAVLVAAVALWSGDKVWAPVVAATLGGMYVGWLGDKSLRFDNDIRYLQRKVEALDSLVTALRLQAHSGTGGASPP